MRGHMEGLTRKYPAQARGPASEADVQEQKRLFHPLPPVTMACFRRKRRTEKTRAVVPGEAV